MQAVKADTEDAILTPNPEPAKQAEPPKQKKPDVKPQPAKKPKPKTYRLTIKTIPSGATVRVTDIGPKYHAGIPLRVGSHTIKVSKAGYISKTKTIHIRNKDVVQTIKLKKKPVAEKPKPSPKPKKQQKLLAAQPHSSSQSNNKMKRIGQYIDHGNGTITDTKTGLMWKKCSEGQYGNNCQGKAKTYTWNNAMQKFKRVSFAGYNNWRMPTIEELRTLVYCSNGKPQQQAWDDTCSLDDPSNNYIKPTINRQAFPNVKKYPLFWSSSPDTSDSSSAWSLVFNYGYDAAYSKHNDGQVRLVSSRQ